MSRSVFIVVACFAITAFVAGLALPVVYFVTAVVSAAAVHILSLLTVLAISLQETSVRLYLKVPYLMLLRVNPQAVRLCVHREDSAVLPLLAFSS